MKLVISKSKEGNGYYTKLKNDYNGKHIEKYLALQIPKGTDLEYGLYDVDGFLSPYERKDGTTEFKLVVTNIMPIEKYDNTLKEMGEHTKTEFDTRKQMIITSEDLPF